jgi:hypothetical protein
VAPASGEVLLRLLVSCDVPFFADIEQEGCEFLPDGYICNDRQDGSNAGKCLSQVLLSVSAGAYYQSEGGAEAATMFAPVHSIAQQSVAVLVPRSELEAQAAEMFGAEPGGLTAPPTLDEMLVQNSEASAMLATMFSAYQQTHVVYPVEFSWTEADVGGGHRRMQSQVPHSQGESALSVRLRIKAPTPKEATRAVDGFVSLHGGRRRAAEALLENCASDRRQLDRLWRMVQKQTKQAVSIPAVSSSTDGVANNDTIRQTLQRRLQSKSHAGSESGCSGDRVTAPSPPPLPKPTAASQYSAAPMRSSVELDAQRSEMFVCGLGSTALGCKISGQSEQLQTVQVSRAELEAQAAEMFQVTPSEQRTLEVPPTLDEMLVSGSEANAMLASMFVKEQAPHEIFPLSFQVVTNVEMQAGSSSEGGRRLQSKGPQSQGDVIGGLHVTMIVRAPTSDGATHALEELRAERSSMFPPAATAAIGPGRRLEACDEVRREAAALAAELKIGHIE